MRPPPAGGKESPSPPSPYASEILSCMVWRARHGYALDPAANMLLLCEPQAAQSQRDQVQLQSAWQWLGLALRHTDEVVGARVAAIRAESAKSLPSSTFGVGPGRAPPVSGGGASSAPPRSLLLDGALTVLRGGPAGSGRGSEHADSTSGLRIFLSQGRSQLARCYGWEVYTDPQALEQAIASLEAVGEYERAALTALFQSGAHSAYEELGRAVRCLERGGSATAALAPARASALKMMAMVLAGYQPRAPLWWSTVHSTAASLSSPHLRLLLAVLCSSSAGSHGLVRDSSYESLPRDRNSNSFEDSGSDSEQQQHPLMTACRRMASNEAAGGTAVSFSPGPVSPASRNLSLPIAMGNEGDSISVSVALSSQASLPSDHGDSSVMLQQIVLHAAGGSLVAETFAPRGESGISGGSPFTSDLFGDALAMACRFLPDAQLYALIRRLIRSSCRAGSIGALCLTGLSVKAVPLMQSYVDRTADVQSVVLMCASGPATLLQHVRVQRWLKVYLGLLNRWQLYHARCKIDIAVAIRLRPPPLMTASLAEGAGGAGVGRKCIPVSRSDGCGTCGMGSSASATLGPGYGSGFPAQVFARCVFCSHSLVTNAGFRHSGRSPQPDARAGPSGRQQARSGGAVKVTACPRCKKPLPRCAICQQHLGCPDPDPLLDQSRLSAKGQERPSQEATRQVHWDAVSSSFGHWMVWCQSCRHGGHAAHVQTWFEQHSECPVVGCSCRCSSKDGHLVGR